MDEYLIIDIGTSSIRAVIIDDEMDIKRAVSKKRTAKAVFDAEDEWKDIVELIRKAAKNNAGIKGIAVSALIGWVGVDKNGNAVTPCYTYMNNRADIFEAVCREHDIKEIYNIAGRRPSPEHAVFNLIYLKENDKILYDKIYKYITLKDYINAKLTSGIAIDHTSAGYSLLYDVRNACWSECLIKKFDIDKSKLPEIKRPYERLGYLKEQYSMEMFTGFQIPVVAGSVDGSTGILGAGAAKPGSAVSVMERPTCCSR